MTEVAVGSMEVLPESCARTDCGGISCPSPPACLSPCTNQDEDESHHENRELEQQKQCNQVQPKKKVKPKGKLVRSMAICEEYSPPGDSAQDSQTSLEANTSSSCLDSEITSCKQEQEKSKDPKKHSVSKESSVEYTDSTGIDLHQFIVDTLNSNPRDRMMLLKLEQDMIDFITSNSPFKKFPHMSSYHRMLVHRVAAYFGMEHNVDQTGKSVIINRTSSTRIPEHRFLEEVNEERTEEIHQWKAILKRDNSSDDQSKLHPLREKQSKSVEEREEEYQRVRDRIFNQEPLCSQENVHAETRAVEEYNPYAETQKRRQLFRGSRDNSGSSWTGSSRQSSTETDCRYSNDPRPWSSTDSDSSYQWTSPVPKHRQAANHSWDTRGTGSISLFRVSSTCPHPSSPPIPEEPVPAANSTYIMENGIPPGSILVNPHTGQPFLNPDGTPAVYNPPDSQQSIRSQFQLPGPASQQQQVVQYSSVSYAAPQVLPVTPSQPYSTVDELSSQFAHVTVSCQSKGEAPPLCTPSHTYVYAAPPPPPPPASNPPSYCQPSPQMPVYYYSQCPTSAQQACRPLSPSQHIHSQAAQPTGFPPAPGVQQSSHSQGTAVMGTYSPMSSHQCGVVQGGVSVSYPQSNIMTAVGGEVGYCYMVPPPSQHSGCHPPSCTNLSAQAWSAQY
ncbi:cAMP-regulated phosphoprotein 21 isoform X2 [Myripristis murdjan]|uniref:cAMP-regulated phosphoprotein 21 isoform X2 n=1 Tax=Myripristis murdjan TaxID=586833 RepID=UPI001175D04D|nr:cAMP-regulated phosphoprotein 21 isoform X2 [Myripristis murdjan]